MKTDRCPVRFLEKLVSKQPSSLRVTGPLYLTPLRKPRESLWYSVQKVGEATIKTYMKTIARNGGIDTDGRRFTNHSIRKTTVRKLQKAGISNDKIASITGHKSEETLRDYAATDMEDHKKISNILSVKPAMGVPCNTVQSVPQASMRQPLQPLSQKIPPCVFNNCTVYFSASSTSSSLMQMQGSSSQQSCYHSDLPCKKRARILDSDDES